MLSTINISQSPNNKQQQGVFFEYAASHFTQKTKKRLGWRATDHRRCEWNLISRQEHLSYWEKMEQVFLAWGEWMEQLVWECSLWRQNEDSFLGSWKNQGISQWTIGSGPIFPCRWFLVIVSWWWQCSVGMGRPNRIWAQPRGFGKLGICMCEWVY